MRRRKVIRSLSAGLIGNNDALLQRYGDQFHYAIQQGFFQGQAIALIIERCLLCHYGMALVCTAHLPLKYHIDIQAENLIERGSAINDQNDRKSTYFRRCYSLRLRTSRSNVRIRIHVNIQMTLQTGYEWRSPAAAQRGDTGAHRQVVADPVDPIMRSCADAERLAHWYLFYEHRQNCFSVPKVAEERFEN